MSTPAVIDASAVQLLLAFLTSWLDRQDREMVGYLIEKDRLLRPQLRGRRLPLTDDDRRAAARASHTDL
jgi:hypothetical protein